ncbi:MAG: hypothetical protein AAFO91_13630, partial [Bacteroidota bacterium]
KKLISKSFSSFEVDGKDPCTLYCVQGSEVYRVVLGDSTPETNTLITHHKETQSLVPELFHSDPANEISLFALDNEHKFFFTSIRKEVKKYDYQTKALVHSFKGHRSGIQQLVFAEDFRLMAR